MKQIRTNLWRCNICKGIVKSIDRPKMCPECGTWKIIKTVYLKHKGHPGGKHKGGLYKRKPIVRKVKFEKVCSVAWYYQ